MGRKRHNLAGLSHFVSDAFGQPPEIAKQNIADTSLALSTRKVSERDGDDLVADAEATATKKRKVGLLGAGNERYDATGLVPFYTDASEVPEHLRKCEHACHYHC